MILLKKKSPFTQQLKKLVQFEVMTKTRPNRVNPIPFKQKDGKEEEAASLCE